MAKGKSSGLSFDEYLRKKKEEESKPTKAVDTSSSTTQKNAVSKVDVGGKSTGLSFDEYVGLKNHTGNTSSIDEVNAWLSLANKVASNFKQGDTTKYTTNYGSDYINDINSLLDTSMDVFSGIYANRDSIKDFDQVKKAWGEYDSYLKSVKSHIDGVNNHYSQWESEEAYETDAMDWLEDGAETTTDKVKARRARYQANKDRIAEIDKEIDNLDNTVTSPHLSEEIKNDRENKKSLEEEKKKLKAENAEYDRTQGKADLHFGVTQNEDFEENSASRTKVTNDIDQVYKYMSQMDSSTWKWKDDVYVDAYGTPIGTNKKGDTYVHPESGKYSVDDPLGLYLDAIENDTWEVLDIPNGLNDKYLNDYNNAMRGGDEGDWQLLKPEEIGIYYYYLNTEGKDKAMSYLDDMTITLNKRREAKEQKHIANAEGFEALLLNIGSVPANIFGGAVALAGDAADLVTGKEYNPYSHAHSMQNTGTMVREETAKDIVEATGGASLLGINWGDVYQAGMSGVDSLVGSAMGGTAYGVFMGASSASNEMKRLYEEGASGAEIVAGGFLSGAAEMVFEKYSIDKFVKMGDAKTKLGIVVNMLKQGGVEASEETLTSIANTITDLAVRGSTSDISKNIDAYMSQGMSQGEATLKALGDVGVDVWKSAVGGFISGGGMGGVGSVASYAGYQADATRHGREILAEKGVPALKALADEVAGVTEGRLGKNIGKLSGKVSSTAIEGKGKIATAIKNRNNANAIGKLSDMVETARISQNTADVVSALEEKGLSSKEAKKAAETIISHLNERKTDATFEDERVAEVYNELVGEGESKLKKTINERNIHHTATRLNIDTKNRTVDGKSIEKEVSTEGKVAESKKTTQISTGEEIVIDKKNAIAKTKTVDGVEKVFFNTDKGVVESTDIQYKNEDEALIYESFTDLHPSVASAAIGAYDGTVPVQAYIKGMREGILLYGKHNFQAVGKDISVYSDLAQLSSEDQALALKLGKAVANIETSKADKALKSAIKASAERAEKDIAEGKKTEKRGSVSFYEGAKPKGHSQKRAITLARVLSKAVGIDIVFYDSMTTTNKDLKGANGMFDGDTDTMYLDLQHSTKDAHTIAFTMSHELVHFVKKYSPAKFKVFADFLVEEYGKHGVSTSTLLANKIDETGLDSDKAYEEMIADACERMLLDSNVMLKLAKLKKIDLDLFEKIRLHILDLLDKIRNEYKRMNYAPTSDEAKELLKMQDVIDKLYEKFEDMVVDATENFQAIGTINLNDYVKAKNTDGGTLFQYKAIKADEGAYRVLLQEHTNMTNAEINSLFATIDKAVDIIKGNLEILDYAWEEDIDDRAFNPVKQNSDPLYKFSVDFSTMCRKRILQQVIIEELQGALDRAVTKAESIAIRNELMKLQEEGRQIEIACALCYVESARMKSPAQIQKFLDDRGDVVRRYFAAKSAGEIKERVAKAEADTRKRLAKQYAEEIAKGDMPDPTEMVGKKTKKFVSLKSLPQKMAEEIRVAKRAVIDGYKPNANESEIIKTAESLSVEDFTSAKGLENLAKYHGEIFDAYTSYIRNATKSKGTEKDVWWRIGDSKKLTDDLIATMNAENGLRTQSWSDFQVMHLLDYIGAIIELSTRKAKMQAYTKVPDYVHLMGNTNQMINLSLIPVAEFNGKLDFDSVEGMAFKIALELRDKYPSTAGTISIGINNEQIRMLLESALIDYVIPYHQSGMSKVVRKQMHIPTWESYESYQSEKSLKYEDAKKNAKAYNVELLSTKDPMWHKAPKFSEWFDVEVARQIAEMENHTPTDPAMQKKYGVMYGAYKAMQNAADTYLKLCAERGISPKFSHESCDFTKEENYWKLLIDRKMINNVTGEIIEQKPVQAVFDEAEILRILNDEVARYPKVKEDQDYATRTVVSKFLSGEMTEDTAKIAASILEKPVNNITKVSILNSADSIAPSKNVKKQAKKSESTDKFNEYSIQTALWDALDHKDEGHDNLIRISNMPSYVVDKFGIDGDFYIYRDHAYENMVTKDQAIIDGRPIKRSGEYIHFHGFGVEKMTSAILSINHPTMTISTKTKDGNPAVVMVLDEFGFNNAPLYAVLSFYSNRGINGRLDRKPHIVFTVAEREYIGTEGRSGYDEIIKNAIKEGRVLDYNAKKRDDLSVIAESAGLGNITKSSLEHNLSRFRKEVNSFREKNKISYQKKRTSYAPTFYSKMERIIDDIKINKMGAGGVVSYLTGKGVKKEEIKWSGIEAFLEGKKSLTKEELQEFVKGSQLQIEEEATNAGDLELIEMRNGDYQIVFDGDNDTSISLYEEDGKWIDGNTETEWSSPQEAYEHYKSQRGAISTRWSQYKLNGGSNYRELLFTMPNSSYSNQMMRVHWGEDAKGVLVHARIQDFDVDGKKMLFVEEIQSDWHNEGHKNGYDSSIEISKKNTEVRYDGLFYELFLNGERTETRLGESYVKSLGVDDSKLHDILIEGHRQYLKMSSAMRGKSLAQDAPFKDTYHEYVLKRLIRMAAEEGYDSIGWTPADIQSERWSDEFAEGYRIEYDQDIPKFLKKYGKQWGATVSKKTLPIGSGFEFVLDNGRKTDSYADALGEVVFMANAEFADMNIDYKVSIDDVTTTVDGNKTKVYDGNGVEIGTITKNLLNTNIWSMDITDSMKNSVLYEGQPKFQKKKPSNRELLSNALESTIDTSDIDGILQSNIVKRYKESIAKVEELEVHLAEVKKEIYELSFRKGSKDMARLRELREDKVMTENRINTYDRRLLEIEATKPMKDLLKREKEMVRKRYEEEGRVKVKKAIARKDESLAFKKERENLLKLVLSTAKWLESPGKNDVKCPDMLRKPFADFLAGIDTSSKRLLKKGVATKNDYKFAMAMDSLATAIDRIKSAQDPSVKTDGETKSSVDLGGYLDLPENFAANIRLQAEGIKSFIDMASNGDSIINDMSADELKELSKIIKILKKGIIDMQTLYTNYRFANAQALGRNTMEYADSLGESKDSTKLKDFAMWDNTVPYYAFKRFGEGGESIFESLMDSQDKLAFLADEILKFKERSWTDKEVSAWSKDSHTIDLPSGRQITLTTADAMSIYCLSRRFQGKQHLVQGGVRVVGLTKKGKKLPDVKANLVREDVDAIGDSLTDRQREVAQKIQEFMSTRCAEWGNEIWMKRFLTTMFNEKNYFPIESDPNVMDYKDPARQQSDLFRLLNISATKPLTEGANNRVVIRNIFDVFSAHSSDMARLNAYGMSLLDYMKWLNYREKATNVDSGEIDVKGVRVSLDNAYGSAAMKYIVNLIKDINGSGDIAKDNAFAMQMMRGSKTAAVGANLRVALLQFTALPRASLVLSPKSIALGVTKKPSIAKAKKYCGMALWKSFGFYDTNIGKSIESQIKGDRTVADKIIEASLKGAELGDSITWGYLWNACEYEVAKTKKYKVGTEEFNQAVAHKLREVIYASQVVDSTLTRSQMMRSKSGLNQMLSAFMSEPTLTYNVWLDALSRFNNEKRRTKSAKSAWKLTKGVITRSISTIMVTSIIVSLAEALADAIRDDEDESFGEKYVDAFWGSFIGNINPLNKIPVASDIMGLIESKLGIGYFSSDRLDTQYLTTLSNAYDAWVDIIMNGEDAEKTMYNAIYNTAKATSQITGLPISNAMREATTLWNNTAGAYDSTLKLRNYDLSNEKLGKELYEAIVEGDSKQAERLKLQFKDEDAVNNALVKAIRENNADVIATASDYINGDLTAYKAMVDELVSQGFDEEVASKAIKSLVSMVGAAAQYEANGDIDAYNEKVDALVALGYDRNQLLEDIETLDKSPADTDKVTSIYTTDDYVTAVVSGNTSMASTIKADLIDTMMQNGKTEEEAEESLSNALNRQYRVEYAEGRMSDSEVSAWVRERNPGDTDADIYWATKEWKVRAEHMDDEDYSYSKYADFHQAILDGDTRSMTAFIQECRQHTNRTTNKEVASDIASAITSHFKPIYKSASSTERARLKVKLLNAYAQLGYARSNRSKLIDKWLED